MKNRKKKNNFSHLRNTHNPDSGGSEGFSATKSGRKHDSARQNMFWATFLAFSHHYTTFWKNLKFSKHFDFFEIFRKITKFRQKNIFLNIFEKIPKPTFLHQARFSAIFVNLWRAGDVRDRLRISSSFDLWWSKIPTNSVSLRYQVFINPPDLGFLSRYTQGRLGDEQETPIPPFGD